MASRGFWPGEEKISSRNLSPGRFFKITKVLPSPLRADKPQKSPTRARNEQLVFRSRLGPSCPAATTTTSTTTDARHVNVRVVNQNGDEVHFRIKETTKFEKLMAAYCERQNLRPATTRFLYDGNRLLPEDTPLSKKMEDGDVIDAVIQQTVRTHSSPRISLVSPTLAPPGRRLAVKVKYFSVNKLARAMGDIRSVHPDSPFAYASNLLDCPDSRRYIYSVLVHLFCENDFQTAFNHGRALSSACYLLNEFNYWAPLALLVFIGLPTCLWLVGCMFKCSQKAYQKSRLDRV